MDAPRCPDCGVSMEHVVPETTMQKERLELRTAERKSGILGDLGFHESVGVVGYLCPECHLVRLYADADE